MQSKKLNDYLVAMAEEKGSPQWALDEIDVLAHAAAILQMPRSKKCKRLGEEIEALASSAMKAVLRAAEENDERPLPRYIAVIRQNQTNWEVTLVDREDAEHSPQTTADWVRRQDYYPSNDSNEMTQQEIDHIHLDSVKWLECNPEDVEVQIIRYKEDTTAKAQAPKPRYLAEVQKTARRSPEQRPLEWTVIVSERCNKEKAPGPIHVRQHFHYTINTSNKMTKGEIEAVRRANAKWIKCDPSEIEVVVINEALPI